MNKLSFLMLLMMALGLATACDNRGARDIDDGIEREEAPLREAGEEMEDGMEDVGDKTEDMVDEVD